MSLFTNPAADVFNPITAGGQPRAAVMGEAQVWGVEVETAINAAVASGALVYANKSAIDADLAHPANTGAWVVNDVGTPSNNGIYSKSGASGTGSWIKRTDLPVGVTGATGKGVLNGSGAPSSGLGTDGDFYVDTASNRFYGPKTGGAWGSYVSMVGTPGDDGDDGIDGRDGVDMLSQRYRPGDAPILHAEALTAGDPQDVDSLTDGDTTTDDDGAVVRLTGPGIVAQRSLTALEPTRLYKARFVVRRRVNTGDPANDAVRVAIAWYDQNKIRLAGGNAQTVIQDITDLTVASGRRQATETFSRSSGVGADNVAPANARYARGYVETYGSATAATDVEIIDTYDTTDFATWSPDVSVFDGRLVTLESLDISARLTDIEAALASPTVLRYQTVTEAEAASIAAYVDFIEVLGDTAVTDGRRSVYERSGSSPVDGFTTVDGAHWEKVAPFVRETVATPSIDWDGPYGGTWKAGMLFGTNDATDQPSTGAYGTLALKRVVDGTGTNGPANASLTLMVSAEQADWLTTTNIREVDAVSAVLRSGKNGDASLFLFNGKKVYDAGAAYGMTGCEGQLYWTDSSEVNRLGVKVTLGGLLNAADVRGGGFGVQVRALVGDVSLGSLSPSTAFLATGDASGGYWGNILVAANGLATTTEFMVLRGAGSTKNEPEIHMGPRSGRIVQRYASNVLSFNWSTDGGSTLSEVFRVTSSGAAKLTLADDSSSAGPNFDIYRNSASPAAADTIGQLRFRGMDSAAAEVSYASIRSLIVDATAGSIDADLDFMTTVAGTLAPRLKARAGIFHPSATGTDKGNNTINFGAVYDDNVLLTDYVFDLFLGREVSGSERIIAKAAAFDVSMFDQATYAAFFRENSRLWGMPDLNDAIDGMVKEQSLGGMIQLLWQTAEINAIHVDSLAQRVTALEARIH